MTRKPLTQGDEDGFCGLYAICNALSLLFPSGMNDVQREKIFKAIAKAVLSKWPDVIWNGTNERDIRSMLGAARAHLNHVFSWEQPFRMREFANNAASANYRGFAEFSRELGWRIKGDNCFAIVGISKPWEHWTCAHRLTEHEMIMTDSCHVKQIPLAKCGLAGDGTEYEFDYRQTFTLMKA